jgi:hypothetical protein
MRMSRPVFDHQAVDVLAVAMALVMFAVLLLLVRGIDRI